MTTRYILRAALFALVFTTPVAASAQSGEQLLARLRQHYSRLTSVSASFTQTMSSPYGGSERFSGTLIAQGDRYRVEAGPQLFVTDGQTTWLHDRRANRVVINRYVPNQTAFSPTTFLSSYSSRYRVARVTPNGSGSGRTYTLQLTPKSRSEMFEAVTLVMRNRDNMVTRIEMRDVNGSTIRYDLQNLQANPRIPSGTFSFTAPRGAEVVDMRS
jgi:outer membrane lipoprotein carrier protein